MHDAAQQNARIHPRSQPLFPVIYFLKCVVTEVVLFSIAAFMTLAFHKVGTGIV